MRVVVTGGRDFDNAAAVQRAFDAYGVTEVAQGGATGADALARAEASARDIPCETYPPQWHKYGKAAGPFRNTKMLTVFNPALVLAFPGGRGTADCVRQARALGIPVAEISL